MSTFEGQWALAAHTRIAIVVARFNQEITTPLLRGALDTLQRLGDPKTVDVIWVPGAFEIAGTAARVYPHYDAIITLGAVIRGETPHFDFVAGAVSNGVSALAARGEKPIIFGVLTCNTTDEAVARAGGKAGNKGSDAALTAVEMLSLYQKLSGA